MTQEEYQLEMEARWYHEQLAGDPGYFAWLESLEHIEDEPNEICGQNNN